MGAWLTSILQGVGRTGNELAEAKYNNAQDKQKQLEQQQKMQQFKMQMEELQQRLATGKAPQVADAYTNAEGRRVTTERSPLTGALSDRVGQSVQPKGTSSQSYLGQNDVFTTKNKEGETTYWRIPKEPGKKPEKIDFESGEIQPKTPPKSQNRDDKHIAIQAKKNSNTPLSKDEKDYEAGYNVWTQKTKVDPQVQKAAAFGANRYIPILDPSDPESVTLMRAYDAAKSGARTPQSISFQVDKAVTKYFTAGPAGTTINYFNTAIDHLKLLRETADALQNGDIQLLNKFGNEFANATGNPAPNNFNTVRSAVSGELSKTFKGTGATDEEVSLIEKTINNSQSPQQLSGAIQYYLRLMGGKMDALKGQFSAGKQGSPNFPSGGDTKTGTTSFTEGNKSWNIPANMVEEFKKAHPNAH